MDESEVVYASPTASDGVNCTKLDPCSIASAFSVTNLSRSRIKLLAGSYSANVATSGKRVLVHGDGATLTANAGTTFSIGTGGDVDVFGLTIVNNAADGTGLQCGQDVPNSSAKVALDRVTADSEFLPFFAVKCTASIRRSRLNVRLEGTSPTLLNSVDLDGVSRPQGTANDLGAFEFVQ